jgi:uncharacterized protein (TIGR03435 family)
MQIRRRTLLIAGATVLAAVLAVAQTPQTATPVVPMAKDAHPSFAVATIKPHDPNSNRQGFNTQGDRVTIRNQTVASLMQFVYAIHPRQIADAPDWVLHDRWDIEGTTDTPGEPSLPQFQEMLQKLLADRFQLHFRREQRELSVYALRAAKGGPKLTPTADPKADPDQEARSHGAELTQTYTSTSMAEFVMGMQFFVPDRPLVDQTGLTGRYDITLRYTPDESKSTDPDAPPGLFTAIQEQLGLKLEPVKAPIDVFVIDHVKQPSAN